MNSVTAIAIVVRPFMLVAQLVIARVISWPIYAMMKPGRVRDALFRKHKLIKEPHDYAKRQR